MHQRNEKSLEKEREGRSVRRASVPRDRNYGDDRRVLGCAMRRFCSSERFFANHGFSFRLLSCNTATRMSSIISLEVARAKSKKRSVHCGCTVYHQLQTDLRVTSDNLGRFRK